jgi:hypothetical protein
LHHKAYQSVHPAVVPQSGGTFLGKNGADDKMS